MNILYQGMSGSAANPQLGGLLLSIGIVVTIVGTILLALSGADENWLALLIIPLACIIIGIFNLIDSRTPVVKATLDDTVSFTEIQKHYEYLGKEGARPRLSRLHTKDWERTKAKIKERIHDLAERLFNLYVERSKIEG